MSESPKDHPNLKEQNGKFIYPIVEYSSHITLTSSKSPFKLESLRFEFQHHQHYLSLLI